MIMNGKKILLSTTLAAVMVCLSVMAGAQIIETSSLPQALLTHTSILLNNKIYVSGGISDTGGFRGTGGFLNNVYYCADINADGTLGDWKVANNLPEFLGLGFHASAVHGNTIYVLGGTNIFGPRNVAYYASVNEDGSLGFEFEIDLDNRPGISYMRARFMRQYAKHLEHMRPGQAIVFSGQLDNVAFMSSFSLFLLTDCELEDPPVETDRAQELREKWGTASGQLWVIEGKQTHRLFGKRHSTIYW